MKMPTPGRELAGAVGPLGPAAALGIGARHVDAHRGAALYPDQDHIVAPADVHLDRRGDRGGDPAAVAAVGRGVELLFDGPEPVQAGECELGARHLLDAPAALAELLDERRVDARAARAAVRLRVLVEQAVSDERDAGHGISMDEGGDR